MDDVNFALGGWGALSWGEKQWSDGGVSLSGIGGVGATGFVGSTEITPSGIIAEAIVGNVTIIIPTLVLLNGVTATTQVGHLLLWGLVDENQNPNWIDADENQNATWVNITDTQQLNWQNITETA